MDADGSDPRVRSASRVVRSHFDNLGRTKEPELMHGRRGFDGGRRPLVLSVLTHHAPCIRRMLQENLYEKQLESEAAATERDEINFELFRSGKEKDAFLDAMWTVSKQLGDNPGGVNGTAIDKQVLKLQQREMGAALASRQS